eukprot:1155956-Pelagomonas_calceolata.AAC.4
MRYGSLELSVSYKNGIWGPSRALVEKGIEAPKNAYGTLEKSMCVNTHKKSKKNKERVAAWQQGTERQGSLAAALNKSAEYTAQRHAGQTAGPKLHTLCLQTQLAAGEPDH